MPPCRLWIDTSTHALSWCVWLPGGVPDTAGGLQCTTLCCCPGCFLSCCCHMTHVLPFLLPSSRAPDAVGNREGLFCCCQLPLTSAQKPIGCGSPFLSSFSLGAVIHMVGKLDAFISSLRNSLSVSKREREGMRERERFTTSIQPAWLMRTGLCSCLSLLQQGNETMADRLLVLGLHEHTHAPCSILEQARTLGSDLIQMWAIKHTMELIAHSLCIANGAPAKVARESWPGKMALLNGQSMGPKSELHQSLEFTDAHWQLIVGLNY